MNTFKSFDLPEVLIDKLDKIQYKEPTPIQAQTIPIALEGKDIFGSAQTGTGKTAAFILPLMSHIINQPDSAALILVPTRELAMQVMEFAKIFFSNRNRHQGALLIGGQPIFKQLNQLRSRPNLIIGTPGRINDHIIRRSLKLNNIKYFVLDEADRMLDMGFTKELETITGLLPKERQTLMFSATVPKNIVKIAEKYLNNPERIAIGDGQSPALKVKQETIVVNKDEKFKILTKELDKREGSIIIFAKTKIGTEKLARKLSDKYKAEFINGDLRQSRRDRVIKSFKISKFRILVATDVAARGLDIPHIEHVINYDIPQCPEDYIHRIGRTGRAGKEGSALAIISSEDKAKWKAILYFIETGKKEPIRKNSSNRRQGGGYGGGNRRRDSFSDRNRSFRGSDNRGGGDNRGSDNRGGGDNRRSDYRGGGDNRRSDNRGGGDNRRSDNRGGGDNRRSDNRGGDNRRSDNRGGDNRRSDNRGGGDNRRSDDRRSDNRRSDNRRSDDRRSDNRRNDNRSDDRRSDDRRSDNRRSDNTKKSEKIGVNI